MIAAAFIGYLGFVAVIGVFAWRRTHSIADYVLGGRRLGAPVAALSAGASDMSGWLLLGLPGLAVVAPAAATWTAVGLLIGTWCNWRFVAAPLRVASGELGALTLPDFFARRFPDHGTMLRVLSALVIVVFFLLYTTAGLVAGGKLFNTVFAIPYSSAVLLGALIIMLYTMLGGFLAVSWTDVLQALMMIIVLVVVAVLVWTSDALTRAPVANELRSLEALPVVSALAWGLGYMGQPHILARFMAMTDPTRVHRARQIALTWAGFGMLAAVLIGAGGGALLNPSEDPERVFIIATEALLAPWLGGICLAAILAAIMSTADSQLLVSSSALAEDLFRYRGARERTPARRLLAGRIAVGVVCSAATVLALDPSAEVLGLVARAWAGFGATLGPAVLVALYRRDACGSGAVAGMLVGALVVGLWPQFPGHGFGVYELLPGFFLATLTNLAVNRARRPRTPAVSRPA